MKKLFIYIIVAMSVLPSCETMLSDFEIEQRNPRINMICVADADSTANIFISRTMRLKEKISYYKVDGLAAEVSENNSGEFLLNHAEGNFYVNESLVFEPGKTYSLKANANNYEEASAEFTVPSEVEITKTELSVQKDQQNPNCSGCARINQLVIDVGIKIEQGSIEYYEVEVIGQRKTYKYNNSGKTDEVRSSYPIRFEFYLHHPMVEAVKRENVNHYYEEISPDYYPLAYAAYLTSENMKKDSVTLRLEMSPAEFGPETLVNDSYLKVGVHKIEKPLFEFALSKSRAGMIEGNPFVEPVSIHTNVNNGAGIVYGKNSNYILVDIKDYLEEIQTDDSHY